MGKGLKQMVAEAEAVADERPRLLPVIVSGDAHADLSAKVRQWTGKPEMVLRFGDPREHGAKSYYAAANLTKHEVVANVDALLLNPNRVLISLTPFRLRQEAVLTGALLHEAAHVRHSLWLTEDVLHTPRQGALKKSERVPTKETVALAKVIEEARIEGIMAAECSKIGAVGLDWTMRASAIAVLPMTVLSEHAEQALMDIIASWTLRAGRQYATTHHVRRYNMASWVPDFNDLLTSALENHFMVVGSDHLSLNEHQAAAHVLDLLVRAVQIGTEGDTGPGNIDRARDILDVLFPETSGGAGKPMPGGGCESQPGQSQPSKADTGDEDADQGEGDGQDGDDQAEGETGEDESGEGDNEPGTGDPELDAMLKEMFGNEGQGGEGDLATEAMSTALAAMEQQADEAVSKEASGESRKPPPLENKPGAGIATGAGAVGMGRGFRTPTPAEREVKANAGRFLRRVIDPSSASRVTLTESPSTAVDPGALAAWRAGGQIRDPRFFKRTARSVQPSPPVKIAVSVDVSLSMDQLAYPSALLSYALASSAVDLRNFAGRGVQVESCLVHWGSEARVIMRNGEPMPGVYEHDCDQTTSAMAAAHGLIEQEMPGFHEVSERPENRLLVNFTDWIFGIHYLTVIDPLGKALEAGVNVITVVPGNWVVSQSRHADVLAEAAKQYTLRGTHTILRYDPAKPEQVWDTAQDVIMRGMAMSI